jgi:hypothetical protein
MSAAPGKLPTELVLAAVQLMGHSGREGTVLVQGESMRPMLSPGQRLQVDFAPGPLGRGDLLLFRQGDALLVHRLLGDCRPEHGRRRLRTRGDGVLTFDPPVDLERVVGRVVALEHDGVWRSLRRGPARAYAWCLAWHDLLWAALGVAVRYPERKLRRARLRVGLRAAVAAVDRRLLAVVHRLLFDRMHHEVPGPRTTE